MIMSLLELPQLSRDIAAKVEMHLPSSFCDRSESPS